MFSYKASQYNYALKEGDSVVLHNFLTKALLKVSAKSYGMITRVLTDPNSLNSKHDGDTLLLLRSQGFVVPNNVDEIEVIKRHYEFHLSGEGSNKLKLVILPTIWCNLRCPYCFEVRRKEFMGDQTQARLLEFVDYKLQEAEGLCVAWFGGEPLLCKNTIQELTKKFQEICHRHTCSYSASLTTNGYLLDKKFIHSLKGLGINSLQVTFDGAPDQHDKFRVLPDGKGTFNSIRRNTEDLCRLTPDAVQLLLRINCSEDNFRSIPELLRLFSSEVKNKAKIFFRWIYPTEASGFKDFARGIPREDKFRILAELSQQAVKSGWTLEDLTSSAPIYCEVDSTNFFQISPNGDVFLCSETFEPEEAVGNVSEWRNIVQHPRYEWYAANPFDDPDCLKCILLPYCMGGCRKARVAGKKCCVEELYDIDALVRMLYVNSLNRHVAA